ncbi:amidohydrolase family protein [Robertkochia flava]|uniref:amidohydrolase family protein n=1 Tax=Robertkochia flava TaxID=3447986 RepID=UPI001CCBB9DF|nr:amidohydrolase family protein [Robertkochia marina]
MENANTLKFSIRLLHRRHVVCFLLTILVSLSSNAQQYDIAILNGRVMDPETNLDTIRNVGVLDGKIALITEESISGKETIDATGHVVCPNFIDTHGHNVITPFGQKLHLRNGVTTPLELEMGVLPVDSWYDSWEGKAQTNYGAASGLQGAREMVLNPEYKTINGATLNDFQFAGDTHFSKAVVQEVATDDQVKKILDLVEEGLKQGGLGVGYTPGYMEFSARSEEGIGAQKLAGKYGRFVAMHGRFSGQQPPKDGLLGTLQQLGAASAYGGGLIVQHLTAQTLGETKEALDLIDAALEKGIPIVAEIYAYTFGQTMVAADYLKPDNYQYSMGRDYGDIVEIATQKPLTKERYEELVKNNPFQLVTFENATQEDLYMALAHPSTIIASDSAPYTVMSDKSTAYDWDTPYEAVAGHPRGAGTNARILRLVREETLMPLMLAISKMTYMPAKYLEENGVAQMANKDRIQVGMDADITIFNPETVKDNATPNASALPSTGIPYVIVNGIIVVKDSKVLEGVYPGQAIRNRVIN